MPVDRKTVVNVLNQTADLMELVGASYKQIQHYRRAAGKIDNMNMDVQQLVDADGNLKHLEGIDKSIAPKIQEIVETGTCDRLESLKQRLPNGMAELAQLPTVGPERAQTLYLDLRIKSQEDLKRAIEQGKLEAEFDKTTIQDIKDDIESTDS